MIVCVFSKQNVHKSVSEYKRLMGFWKVIQRGVYSSLIVSPCPSDHRRAEERKQKKQF